MNFDSVGPDEPQGLTEPLSESLRQQQALLLARVERAQAQAAQAFARLLDVAAGDTGQAGRVAQFLAATLNGGAYRFNLFDLRLLDVQISDDMLVCLDALRWGKTELHRLVPQGYMRVQAVICAWGLKPETWS